MGGGGSKRDTINLVGTHFPNLHPEVPLTWLPLILIPNPATSHYKNNRKIKQKSPNFMLHVSHMSFNIVGTFWSKHFKGAVCKTWRDLLVEMDYTIDKYVSRV